MQVKREARIYKRKLPSGNITFRVDMGKVNGKRVTKDFPHENQALKLKAKWDAEIQTKNLGALQDLAAMQKREVMLAIERLNPFGATVLQAADFYLKYAIIPKGPISIEDAVTLFLAAKRRANRRERYVKALEVNYLKPLQKAFPTRVISEISSDEMHGFIYARERAPKTVMNYLKSLDVFFHYLIREGYCTLNPLKRIEKPMLGEGKAAFLTVENVTAMLQFALDHDRAAECASMVLVFFCGVRVEEVEKLTWADVRLDSRRVVLEAAVAKKRRRRVNGISDNAYEWLVRCHSTGPVASKNYDNRLRFIRQQAGVKYSQNAMRHSFASYHVAFHEDAALTAFMLGHPDSNLLYSTYRDLVPKEDAAKYWEIVPAEVAKRREEERAKQEAALVAKKQGIKQRMKRGEKLALH
jgi:site-specific recombinase XerD